MNPTLSSYRSAISRTLCTRCERALSHVIWRSTTYALQASFRRSPTERSALKALYKETQSSHPYGTNVSLAWSIYSIHWGSMPAKNCSPTARYVAILYNYDPGDAKRSPTQDRKRHARLYHTAPRFLKSATSDRSTGDVWAFRAWRSGAWASITVTGRLPHGATENIGCNLQTLHYLQLFLIFTAQPLRKGDRPIRMA